MVNPQDHLYDFFAGKKHAPAEGEKELYEFDCCGHGKTPSHQSDKKTSASIDDVLLGVNLPNVKVLEAKPQQAPQQKYGPSPRPVPELPDIQITAPKSTDPTQQSYELSSLLLKKKLMLEHPQEVSKLENITKNELIVTAAAMDRVQQVFDSAGIPYSQFTSSSQLTPGRILFINCPGSYFTALSRVRNFVNEGGYLVTSDWAISSIIQRAFKGTIRHAKSEYIPERHLEVSASQENHYVKGMFQPGEQSGWWIEACSYPIRLIGQHVDTLLESHAPKHRPIAVTFPHGKGRVFHALSHFYLQEKKPDSSSPGNNYLQQKFGLNPREIDRMKSLYGAGNIEQAMASYASLRFLVNIILDKYR